jgi:hypothetical protein
LLKASYLRCFLALRFFDAQRASTQDFIASSGDEVIARASGAALIEALGPARVQLLQLALTPWPLRGATLLATWACNAWAGICRLCIRLHFGTSLNTPHD